MPGMKRRSFRQVLPVLAVLFALSIFRVTLLHQERVTAQGVSMAGTWQGTLAPPGASLRLALNVTQAPTGALAATLDSIDQRATLPVRNLTAAADVVRFELQNGAASFEGRLSADGQQIDGKWSQNGVALPLVLKRGGAPIASRRPQEPSRPFPYFEQDVSYRNTAAGITLGATLTLPNTSGRVPAVVLITGSGSQDRDESIAGHKPFLVIADYLTRHGIAVLRADDRGVGSSQGKADDATSDDLAGDVLAGIEFLKRRKEIDPAHLGVLGHSEGGLIGPIAATRSSDVSFVVMMAGSGLPGEDILYLQGAAIAKAAGASEAQIAANVEIQKRLFTIIKTEKDTGRANEKLAALADEIVAAAPAAGRQAAAAQVRAQIDAASSRWFRYFLTYDPRPTLTAVRCPVLAMNGERDTQVPYAENLAAIETALKSGGHKDVTLVHLPGLNHLFQTAATGAPTEYAQIEETMAPIALQTVGDWIVQHTR